MLRTIARAVRSAPQPRYSVQIARGLCTKSPETDAVDEHLDENLLESKNTRQNIRNAFANRCVDSIRYEYFAQRADLEAETDAALLFRSLTETAKQQAMGYMELLEEYGDADFGDTLRNLEVSAEQEKQNSQGALREHSLVAGREELEPIEDYFEDMADASEKVWTRLELTASMYDLEGTDIDDVDDDGVQIPEKAKH